MWGKVTLTGPTYKKQVSWLFFLKENEKKSDLIAHTLHFIACCLLHTVPGADPWILG